MRINFIIDVTVEITVDIPSIPSVNTFICLDSFLHHDPKLKPYVKNTLKEHNFNENQIDRFLDFMNNSDFYIDSIYLELDEQGYFYKAFLSNDENSFILTEP